jgi:two-component system, OmpR family, sensor histidine kinase BaeS
MKTPAANDSPSAGTATLFKGGWLRLTIAKKIALAIIVIVVLCVGTMAWVSSRNLQRGFIEYLNQLQAQDLDQLGTVLEQRYHAQGNFDWLRRNPRAMRDIFEQLKPSLRIVGGDVVAGRRRWQRGEVSAFDDRPPPEARRPPPEARRPPPEGRRPPPGEGWPPGPPPDARAPPPADRPPAEAGPPRPIDSFSFGARLSITDEFGQNLLGPPDLPKGIKRPLVVDGRTVGMLNLMPIQAIPKTGVEGAGFIRAQIDMILWLAAGLCIFSVVLAWALARHLLRPVVALRSVTRRLAEGQFDARAPIINRDELAELAQHVNEMAQALADNEQKRRKLLADIAHELRTPLTVIRGEIEAMQDGIRKTDKAALESLHGEVLHLNTMVNDIHQLTMADAGDLHYHWQSFDLVGLLENLLNRFQARIEAAGLKMTVDLPKQPVMMMGDKDRLSQVFTNLLENSLRYTDSGGQMILVLSRQGGNAVLALEDSAPGVPDDAWEKMFERLYRVDQARSRAKGGTGLGLSICRAMVEAHEGSIKAMPSRLGGVKMLLNFPLRVQAKEGS